MLLRKCNVKSKIIDNDQMTFYNQETYQKGNATFSLCTDPNFLQFRESFGLVTNECNFLVHVLQLLHLIFRRDIVNHKILKPVFKIQNAWTMIDPCDIIYTSGLQISRNSCPEILSP
mmetsp:Transcript_21007/g.42850  ORF Transcript_21007/g.42850 Transcript_21007/m.42850 type:complete len:117 (+) Transcript_21007:128-478(+)